MKTLIAFGCLAAIVLSLNACNKNGVTPDSTASSARATATDSLHTKPGSLTIIATTSLPATVTSYITTTYAGAVIKQAGKDSAGKFLVLITVNSVTKLLVFNADGTFNTELAGKGHHAPGDSAHHAPGDTLHGPGRGHGHAPGDSLHGPGHAPGDSLHGPGHGPGSYTAIVITSLPTAITSYITTNYAGSTIKQAGKSALTGDILVEITTAANKRVGLLFAADGTFKKVVTRR